MFPVARVLLTRPDCQFYEISQIVEILGNSVHGCGENDVKLLATLATDALSPYFRLSLHAVGCTAIIHVAFGGLCIHE